MNFKQIAYSDKYRNGIVKYHLYFLYAVLININLLCKLAIKLSFSISKNSSH